MSGVAVENSTLTLSGDHAKEGGGWHWLGGSLPGGRQRQRGFAGKVGGLSRLPPLFHFREKGFCWQKNPLSVIVMLIISYAKWAWQRQCSSRKDSCWREQPLRRLVVSEEAQRKWPPHWNPSVWPWGAGGSALQGGEHLREEVCQAETCGEVFPQNFPHLSLIRLRTF